MAAYNEAMDAGVTFACPSDTWLDLAPLPLPAIAYEREVRAEAIRMAAHKSAMNELYSTAFPPEMQLPRQFQQWRFNILVSDPGAVLSRIRAAGLFASNHYAPSSPVFGGPVVPIASALHGCVLNLFNDRYFDLDSAERLIAAISPVIKPAPFENCISSGGSHFINQGAAKIT